MATKFQGLPGEQELVRRGFQKRFEDAFGRNANAKELYLADPCFFRFARLFPRPAYLLVHLQVFYRDLRRALDIFVQEVCRSKISTMVMGPFSPPEDPFLFFHAGYDYCYGLLHLRAALVSSQRATESLVCEVAQDVIDNVYNADRRDIVNELLSADLATELDKRAGHTSELGFWQVRRVIAHTEAILSSNARHILDRLEYGDKKDVQKSYSHCRKRDRRRFTERPLSPFAGDRSPTPASPTFDDPEPEEEEGEGWAAATKKRRLD